jgi:hypothetical protein
MVEIEKLNDERVPVREVPAEAVEGFDKVDRALEMSVIDWLQFAEFPESLIKAQDDSDRAQLTLILIAKRKRYTQFLEEKVERLEKENQILLSRLGSVEVDLEAHRANT